MCEYIQNISLVDDTRTECQIGRQKKGSGMENKDLGTQPNQINDDMFTFLPVIDSRLSNMR